MEGGTEGWGQEEVLSSNTGAELSSGRYHESSIKVRGRLHSVGIPVHTMTQVM